MPPQTGYVDFSLTAGGLGVWLPAKQQFNIGNSGLNGATFVPFGYILDGAMRSFDNALNR